MSEQQACTLCGADGHSVAQCSWNQGAAAFQREDRYIVIKRSDLKKVPVAYRSSLVDPMFSLLSHLPRRECLVIESDWPEYKPTWRAIEERMTGSALAQPSPAPALDDQAFDDNAERLTRDALGTGAGINPNATSIDDLFLDAGPELELEKQEGWQAMDTAPKDGSLIRLLVHFEDMSIDDGEGPFATIGQNNLDNDGEDRWQVVGWCWEHDHFTDGKGTPVGWMPMLAAPVAQAGQVPESVRAWFEAKQAHVNAVDAYNARLKFVREHCPFGTSVDPEYQLMEDADRKARSLVGPMFDGLREMLAAAPAQGERHEAI